MIGRTVVHRDDFVVVIIEFQQLSQRLLNVALLVPRRHDDRNSRMRVGISIPQWLGNVGDMGHADRRVDDSREPRERQKRSCGPMKIMHLSTDWMPGLRR